MISNGFKQFHKNEDFITLIGCRGGTIGLSISRVSTIDNNKYKTVDLSRSKENLITAI